MKPTRVDERPGKKAERAEKKADEKECCPICIETYTPQIRKKCTCEYCKQSTCSKCIERYLTTVIEDAHCPHCRVAYNDIALKNICTQTYLRNIYFKHRQQILMNKEKIVLPTLQEAAQIKLRLNSIMPLIRESNETVKGLKNLYINAEADRSKVYYEMNCYKNSGHSKRTPEYVAFKVRLKACKLKRDELYSKLSKAKSARDSILRARYRLEHGLYEREDDDLENGVTEEYSIAETDHKKFVRKCTRDSCTGFLNTAWHCGMCKYFICNKCFVPIGEKKNDLHECKKEDVDTAELIKKDTKPCPACGEIIMKDSGCDMMWCISCHTPFSWNTGKVITSGAIHNPHYYEWLRKNGKDNTWNPAHVPCGGIPGYRELARMYRGSTEVYLKVDSYHRLILELQERFNRLYQSHLNRDSIHNIHVRYLIKEIDEKRWGQLLAIDERKRKFDNEMQEVFAACRMVSIELFNRIANNDILADRTTPRAVIDEILSDIIVEFEGLVEMTNEAFEKVANGYNVAPIRIVRLPRISQYAEHIYFRIDRVPRQTGGGGATKSAMQNDTVAGEEVCVIEGDNEYLDENFKSAAE